MPPATELLFVYGTLRRGSTRGGFAARLEAEADWLGAAQVRGSLYQVHPDYPGLAEPQSENDWITGEVWEFADPALWAALDQYEGAEYVRVRRPVTITNGEMANGEPREAWVYLYASKITKAMAIVSV